MRVGVQARRWLSRACAIGAVGCFLLVAVGSVGAQEEATPRPDVFRASAEALVSSAYLDREALLPVPEAFRFIALEGTGTYESSNQTARSSVFFPGNGVVTGPNLACGTFGSQFPEEFSPIIDACLATSYPLTVFADSLNPDAGSAGGTQLGQPGDPVSAKAVRAVAHAAPDASFTDAAMSNLRVGGLPGFEAATGAIPVPGAPELDDTVFGIEGAEAKTDQRIDEAGVLTVEAESVLSGVKLIGGLVQIDSIRSVVTITDDGRGGTTRSADLEMSGVTAGGVPAEITEDGLVVGDLTGADGPLAQQLTQTVNQLVGGLGLEITTLDTEAGVDDNGVAFARVGGVLVEFNIDVQGLPILPGPIGDIDPNGIYTGVIQLGAAGATGISSYIDVPPFTPGTSPPATSGGGFIPPAPPANSGGGGGGPSGGGTAIVPDTGDEVASPSAPEARPQFVGSVLDDLYAGRMELVYLAFTLMALGVCIAPRLALPARLPRSTS